VHIFFTDREALKSTLINYLTEIQPTMFTAVPRVYEKMEERLKAVLEQKKTILNWAVKAGRVGTD
jgi:long-subunit acyl-CoA synthetase (AMP-forming)